MKTKLSEDKSTIDQKSFFESEKISPLLKSMRGSFIPPKDLDYKKAKQERLFAKYFSK